MSLSDRHVIKTQVLRLRGGEVVKGRILSMINMEFLVAVPREDGYGRRWIPFPEVEYVNSEARR